MDSEVVSLPPEVREGVDRLASDWTAGGHVGRLWSRDAALWTGGDEPRWLGWLDIAGTQLEHLGPLQTLQQDIAHGPFDHAVLLGMGGSSLCPDVLRQSFGRVTGAPDLRVLDSTDPAQVRSVAGHAGKVRKLAEREVHLSRRAAYLEPLHVGDEV